MDENQPSVQHNGTEHEPVANRRALLAGIGGLAAGTILAGSAQAGSLTPPGAPNPTMKTMVEVEPRVQLSSATTPGDANAVYVITKPGSYYLMENLFVPSGMSGIRIETSEVSLDLNGFLIRGFKGLASVFGIFVIEGRRDVVIKNGFIREFVTAVQAEAAEVRVLLNGLHVTINDRVGVHLPAESLVEHCTFESSGGAAVGSGSRVSKCLFLKGYGIGAGDSCVIEGNVLKGTVAGIAVNSGCVVEENVLESGDTYGIFVGGSDCVIRRNVVRVMGMYGLRADGVRNTIADNSIRQCNPNYIFASGNFLDLLISELPQTLSWPCMATLEGSLTGVAGQSGITITTQDVTLDLGGHVLRGGPNSVDGILGGANCARVVVRNGSVVEWGGTGVRLGGAPDCVCEQLRVSQCAGTGVSVGELGRVERCRVRSCTVGIAATSGAVKDCSVSSCPEGIRMVSDGTVEHCVVRISETYGIHASGVGVVVQDNTVMNNPGVGLRAKQPGGGNTFRDNHVRNNGINYDFVTGNLLELLISQVPQELKWPCVAKLEGNVVAPASAHGLIILSDDITIDLGGHSLVGTGGTAAYDGVHLDSRLIHQNITIHNGTIRNWGHYGAELQNARNVRVEGVHFLMNSARGLALGSGAVVVNCTSYEAMNEFGFTAEANCTFEDCVATGNESGFLAGEGCVLRGCTAGWNRKTGFELSGASLIECTAVGNRNGVFAATARIADCAIRDNGDYGINAGGSLITGNRVENNGKNGQAADNAGIAAILQCRVEGNHCRDNFIGIYGWESGQNVIIRNTCTSNGTNWAIMPGNAVARIQIAVTNPGLILGDSYAGNLGTTDPTANFTH